MDHLRALLALIWAKICWLAATLQAISKVIAALLVIASFTVLVMHFLHVEVNPRVPDVWPIFQPSGFPSVSDVWEHIHA